MSPASRTSPSTPTKPRTAALTRSARLRKQAGFLILEATVVLGLIALAAVSYMALQMMQTRIDKGKVVGEKYARINASLGQYMSIHSAALKGLHPECSLHGLASITSKTKLVGTTCNLKVNDLTLVNGLQPTVEELVKLGLLRTGTTDALDLLSKTVIAAPKTDGTVGTIAAGTSPSDAKYSPAPAKLLAVITQRCVPTANALSGRYVLIRRPNAGDDLTLDEVEIISNGSNVASSAVITSSPVFTDNRLDWSNSLAYYGTSNLVDLKLTNPPPVSAAPYVTPGVFRSQRPSTSRAWVQFDLGWQRDISNIGLRSAKGADPTGVGNSQVGNWEEEGALPIVEISNTPVTSSTGLIDTASTTVRTATTPTATPLVPGIMKYYSNTNFSAAPNTVSTPTAQGCPASSWMALSSLLFNTQPYVLPSWQGSGAMLAMALQHAGSEAAMSNPAGSGELKNSGLSLDNPLRYYDTNPETTLPRDTGVGGIIAVRNGYDSADGQTNPDGSTLPSEAWDLNGQNLFNVNSFQSATATVQGNITANGTVSGNTGNFTNLNASTGNFTNVNVAATAAALDVSATRGSFNALKLPVAVAGAACTSATQSIAQDSTGMFLTCTGTKWSSVTSAQKFNPSEYYKVQIKVNYSATAIGGTKAVTEQWCPSNDVCKDVSDLPSIPSIPSVLASVPTAVDASNIWQWPLTLKVSEWLPVVGYHAITQNAGSDPLTTYFNISEKANSPSTWNIGVKALKADMILLVRFYRINP